MATEPIYDRFTERFYAGLPDCYREADADNLYALKHYVSAILDELRKVMDLYARLDFDIETEGGLVGDSTDLLNPATADAYWLRWIAQMLGISIEAYKDIVRMRGGIVPTFTKHTVKGLEEVAKSYLQGMKRVRVVTGKEPDEISFVCHPDDVYWNALPVNQATVQKAALEALDSTALSPNMLDFDTATFEGSLTWVSDNANATLALDAANFYEGTKGLAATVVADGLISLGTDFIPLFVAVPDGLWANRTFTATAVAKTNGPSGYRLYLRWYDMTNTYISQTVSTNFTGGATWTTRQLQSIAPANAMSVRLVIGNPAGVTGDIVYIDQCGAWRGKGGTWTVDGAVLPFRPTLQEFPYSKDPVVGWINTPEGVAYRTAFGLATASDDDLAAFASAYNQSGTVVWSDTTGAFEDWIVPLADMLAVTFGDEIRVAVKARIPRAAHFPVAGLSAVTMQVRWYDVSDALISTDTDPATLTLQATGWTTLSKALVPPVDAVSVSVALRWSGTTVPVRLYLTEFEVVTHYTGTQNVWQSPSDNFDAVKIVKDADFWLPDPMTYVGYRHAFTWDSLEVWGDFIGTQVGSVSDGVTEEPLYVNDWNAFVVMSGFLNSPTFDVIE